MTEEDRLQLRDVAMSSQLLPDLRYLSTWEGELTASTDVVISPDFEWLAFGLRLMGEFLCGGDRRRSPIEWRLKVRSAPIGVTSGFRMMCEVAKFIRLFNQSRSIS